jgi:hypothetical protein
MSDTYCRSGETGAFTSGVLAADTLIKTGAGKVFWISFFDAADLTLQLNDSLANGGTDKWAGLLDVSVKPGEHINFDPPLEFSTGIYLDVDTATCLVTVCYV